MARRKATPEEFWNEAVTILEPNREILRRLPYVAPEEIGHAEINAANRLWALAEAMMPTDVPEERIIS